MDFLIQLLVSGVAVGGVYALVGLGFVAIFKATGILNFATGEFMMIGAYFGYTALVGLHLPFWAALLVALAGAAAVALVVERALLRPLFGQPTITVVMVTLGLSSILKGLAQIIWTAEFRSFPRSFPRKPVFLGPAVVPSRLFYGFLIALAAVAVLAAFFRYARAGVAMRATASDQGAAYSLGVDIRRMFGLAWGIGAAAAALGGVVVGTIGGISPQLGALGLKVFPVVILGGLDSVAGAIVGGILIGVLENLAGGYLDPYVPGGSVKEVVPFLVLLLILLVRPYGLFGTREIERV
ncbi:MAG: branched-chain amino acid ABC transporter permease [Deltaproteobacteria bacterium]|nr:branched-chain amino acid ABC transporter permease [Deltaproteobacteria bacterium]